MDSILDEIAVQVRRCERAARIFDAEPLKTQISRLSDAAEEVGKAWSGSWLGYQSRVYYAQLAAPPPGARFSIEWGFSDRFGNATLGEWEEWQYEDVINAIHAHAGDVDLNAISDAAQKVREVFEECQMHLLAILDAVLAEKKDTRLEELRGSIAEQKSQIGEKELVFSGVPGEVRTRDQRVMNQGVQAPPHKAVLGKLMAYQSTGYQAQQLAKYGRQAMLYIEKRMKMKGTSVAKKEGKVFIGHGHSPDWKDLRDFLKDRLHLTPDEFNMQPTAGFTTKERLEQMLDEAVFAFVVMTAEDEHADASKHARENVIHEIGLFQGRLGFRRAIVLLEQGCAEFSNIQGLGQIRFSKGNIKAKSEDIREILEREGLL